MKVQRFIATAAAAGLALSLSACGDDGGAGAGGGDDGTVTIGIKFDQPGLGLKEGDEYTGFDVDVAEYVAKELGYEDIEWIQAPSPQRETLIQSGQVDMVFATYSITDERKQKVSFAGPYLIAGQDLLVAADSDISGPEDLAGKQLCSVSGSTSAQNVKDDFPKVELQNFDTYSKCLDLVVNGQLDALTTDNAILAGYAAQPAYKGKLKVVGKTFSTERYGVGIEKGNVELCEKINDALAKMIEEGKWKEFVEKNFGDAGFQPDPSINPPEQDPCS